MSLKESKASTIKNSTSCFPQTGSNTGLIKHLYFTRWGSSEGYEPFRQKHQYQLITPKSELPATGRY
jgi:hypothetical protein